MQILSFENKNAIANYGRKAGFESFAEVNLGWAMDIMWMETYGKAFGGFATIPEKEGFLTLRTFPMSNNLERIPWTSVVDDYGDAVHAVLIAPEKYDRRSIWAISDYCSFQDVADAYNRVTGTLVARHIPETERLKAATPGKTKEVNGLRDYCHYTKGNSCNGKSTGDGLLAEMRQLKQVASVARGRGGDATTPQTIEGFIRAYDPGKQASV